MKQHNLSSFINQNYFKERAQNAAVKSISGNKKLLLPNDQQESTKDLDNSVSNRTHGSQSNMTSYRHIFETTVTRDTSKRAKFRAIPTLTEVLDSSPDRIICSIFENRNSLETKVGICAINLNLGTLTFSEFIDSQIFIRVIHKLQIYNPTEILVPTTSMVPTSSKLISVIKYNVPEATKISNIPHKLFDDREGLQIINKFQMESKKANFVEKTHGLRAIAGAFEYINNRNTKDSLYHKFKSLRIVFEAPDDTMLIDLLTIKNLELVENNIERDKLSLLKFLDSTSTCMGRRLLRNNILQPLTNEDGIALRIEAVKEMLEHDGLLETVCCNLKHFHDMDKLFSKLLYVENITVRAEQKVNYVLLLKNTIRQIQLVNEIFTDVDLKSSLLREVKRILGSPAIKIAQKEIDNVINEDCGWASSNINLQNQKIYAVKNGSNGLLEAARGVYKNIIDQISEEVEQLSDDLGVPVDHTLDSSRGFVIRIPRNDWPDMNALPEEYINKVVKGRWIECHTLKLIKFNTRLRDIITEICLLSEKAVHSLLNELTKHIAAFFMVSEAISLLDLICSYSTNTSKYKYTFPEFGYNIQVEDARHPVLDTTLPDFVPNNIRSIKGSSNLQIITGCNMSGKSVYLKQVALLCIMFQIGCPIPAKSATLPIFKNLHARLCNDSLELSSSNFMFEMKETAYCMDGLSEDTLLILDELGRNSSVCDGLAISLAATEFILHSKCVAFISTHFQEIPKILINKPSVMHLHMRTDILGDKMKMLYRLHESSSIIEHSALKVVSKIFPKAVIDNSYVIANNLSNCRNNNADDSDTLSNDKQLNQKEVNQMKKIQNFLSLLRQNSMEDKINLDTLKLLQMQFMESFTE
ncbi:similar to Saccharomyces cerevisiae YFL003C MSH4 Protein involved in meiotic recombination [Maudiozyma saulgeensis]|uniref:Similar to Saccharomyces cerevisiae YFL003C MSH4 Protein involved in meiotic recombination n=1 Tax=Maudiozyma saulgeensis TaxID=1789683 RepID=A0A1X7QZ81_9SACH|nr:similar to Saccharomyces cerevisiae YFL003C MSH4 Protein involved in meiotic recombination [Kazachstania saulgeensis]